MKTNCPNCGAPIERYKCKCEYCGTWYFDFTGFDMSEDVPYYVKFKMPGSGVITTLAKPELRTVDISSETVDIMGPFDTCIKSFYLERQCDLEVVFHAQKNPENGTLYTLEVDTDYAKI